jgi:hypothetical protein
MSGKKSAEGFCNLNLFHECKKESGVSESSDNYGDSSLLDIVFVEVCFLKDM